MEAKNYSRLFTITSAFMLGTIALWAYLQTIAVQPDDVDRLQWLDQNIGLFKLNYFVGSILTFPSVLLLALMVFQRKAEGQNSPFDIVGLMCLTLYLVFIQMAYCSQYLFIPELVQEMTTDDQSIFKWFYIGNPSSLPAFLRLMGYTFMSVSAIIIGFPFVRVAGYSSWVSWSLFLSGVAGILGWLEFYLGLSTKGLGVAISGLLMIPFCLAILITAKSTKIVLKSGEM